MSVEYIADRFGHRWPVTGDWCRLCGMPLANIGQDAHPNCKTPTGVPWMTEQEKKQWEDIQREKTKR